jgi:hypothetical protein
MHCDTLRTLDIAYEMKASNSHQSISLSHVCCSFMPATGSDALASGALKIVVENVLNLHKKILSLDF